MVPLAVQEPQRETVPAAAAAVEEVLVAVVEEVLVAVAVGLLVRVPYLAVCSQEFPVE